MKWVPAQLEMFYWRYQLTLVTILQLKQIALLMCMYKQILKYLPQ